jgi:3-isopropylmalate/(R)-2-methylmalate dehydratase small subunit
MTERPAAAAVRQHLEGAAISLRGDDIDTDQIIPARFLKGITFVGLGEHAFADARQAARERGGLHPFDDLERQAARILLVNKISAAAHHASMRLRPCTGGASPRSSA